MKKHLGLEPQKRPEESETSPDVFEKTCPTYYYSKGTEGTAGERNLFYEKLNQNVEKPNSI